MLRISPYLAALVLLASCGLDHDLEAEDTTPQAIRGPRAWADETWLAPNLASPDLRSLFSQPELWPLARTRVNVLQLYAPQITQSAATCPQCGNNVSQPLLDVLAYAKLRSFGIELAIEAGLIKAEYQCAFEPYLQDASKAVNIVKAAGGALTRITLDEPLYALSRTDVVPGCAPALRNDPYNTIADDIATMRQRILQDTQQDVKIGLVEPYPAISAQRLMEYLSALVQRGVRPAHFHLDVDDRILPPSWLTDMRALRQHAANLGIPFGVLYGPGLAASNESFYAGALQQVDRYTALGRQEHAVFQSFAAVSSAPGAPQIFPVNLPENHPSVLSMTRLIIEGTNRLASALPAWSPPRPAIGVAATFSDAAGFGTPTTGDTLMMGDLNGDGRDDLVARASVGLIAQLSQGTSFAPGIVLSSHFSDAEGWFDAARARSLRLADVNHDGQVDVIGYDPSRGVVAALGTSTPPFTAVQVYPIFVGASSDPGSLGFADVTGDGLGDLVIRGASGLLIAPAIGRGVYGPARLATAEFSPAGGWTAAPYARIAYADVNLDGCADVAARGVAGVWVGLSSCGGATFRPATVVSSFYADAVGFGDPSYATSFQLGDTNADGCADLVMRGWAGVWTSVSDCAGHYPFPAQLTQAFSDAAGFGATIYRDTFRLGDPAGLGRAAATQRGGAGVYTVY